MPSDTADKLVHGFPLHWQAAAPQKSTMHVYKSSMHDRQLDDDGRQQYSKDVSTTAATGGRI